VREVVCGAEESRYILQPESNSNVWHRELNPVPDCVDCMASCMKVL